MRSRSRFCALLSASLMIGGLSSCSVTTNKDARTGKDKDVDIRTPLGSLSVHKGISDVKDTGLLAYPGAQLKKDLDDEDGGANVNISSSFFGMKVVALKYESNDAPDKILNFYRKDMAKYGNVVACTGGVSMSFHHRDRDSEVTCNDHGGDHSYREELKVGTENNQRIVAVKPSGNGSEFALVYVRAWDDKSTM